MSRSAEGGLPLLMLRRQVEPNGCWTWKGVKPHTLGYVDIRFGGGPKVKGHRAAYEWARGPIPDGLELDHLCRNRWCVNPWHLEAVTHLENVRRGASGQNLAARTHCPRGHPYDEKNTMYRKSETGTRRVCRTCDRVAARLRMRQRQAKKKAARLD